MSETMQTLKLTDTARETTRLGRSGSSLRTIEVTA
jgi:hypothetical protein